MANFGRRNLGPRRGNSRDLSPQGPFSGDLSRSKKNPDRESGFLRGFAAGRSRRAMVSAAGAASAINGGRRLPQPAAPIGAAADGRPATQKNRQHRKAGSAERQAADDRQTAPDGGPQQDDGPCRAAGYNRKLAATGRRAVPDSRSWAEGWPCRTAGRGRKAGRAGWLAAPDGWPRTGYRKSINS